MATGVLGTAARQDPRQVSNTMKKTVNAVTDAAPGVAVPFANYLPQGAFILGVWIEVPVAFNGTTPTLSVGTNSPTYNNIVAAGDATWNATGSPSAGQAIIVLEFEGGWSS